MTRTLTMPEVGVGTTPYLKLKLDLQTDDFPYWPFVHFDVSAEEFVVLDGLLLTFLRYERPVAVVSATPNVYCKQAMVTTTSDTLQIQFWHAKVVDGSLSVKYTR